MPTPPALTLGDGAALVFERLILVDFANGFFSQTPNFRILTPSPKGTVGALAVVRDVAAVMPICLPADTWERNLGAAIRPLEYPGTNRFTANTSQAGCVNSTSAPPLQRCWPGVYLVGELVAWSAVITAAGNFERTTYNIWLDNVSTLCQMTVSQECVAQLGPIGCLLYTARGGASPAPAPWPGTAATPPPGVTAATADAGSSGSGGVNEAAIIGGSIAGGVVLLGLMGLVAWAVVRRRRGAAPDKRGSTGSQEAPSTVDWPPTADASVPPAPVSAAKALPSPRPHPSDPSLGVGLSLSEVVVTPDTPLKGMPVDVKVTHDQAAASPAISFRSGAGRSASTAPSDLRTGATVSARGEGQSSSNTYNASGNGPDTPACSDADTGFNPSIAASIHCGGGGGGGEGNDPVVRLTGVILGKGGFGRVYQGTFRGSLVAVKQLLDTLADAPVGSPDQLRESFLQVMRRVEELEVLGRCDHPNIVKVLAASVMGTTRPVMVLELMETSLDKVLYGSRGVVLPLATVLHIGREVAQGLSYLHPTVLHRDLKPANVLMNVSHGGRPVVKISDFGLSRLRTTILVTERPEAGTPAYMAPECYEVERIGISYHVDCYSFGVLLWEMLAGAHPWAGLSAVQVAHKIVLQGQRLETPPASAPGGHSSRWPPRLQRLLAQCWEADPLRRPAAADIVKTLALVEQELSAGGGEAQAEAQAQAQAHAAQHGKKQEAAMIEFSMA
ncbi:hypothetical protein HYH03_007145 [Edaphochlamys debaryana]|uniref:Protein kinase domain-containing protein n=1 Tax=Edaphochlamys debaryana TaxID=47281 RepID=A0A835Y2B1_9CHLO|nr:hypothetical protein HYH03_007145 [Edaphochlamys debaryana]|eukprot:KAG2494626.1 hypothetical protein HYH03_007145 [Edaphochlamys debaryana]